MNNTQLIAVLTVVGSPGLAPAATHLFFASPKKSKQKKGDPQSGPRCGALRCSNQAGSRANSPLAQTSTCPDPLGSPLLSPATRDFLGTEKFRLHREYESESVSDPFPQTPSVRAEQRSKTGNQRRACLSAASLHASDRKSTRLNSSHDLASRMPSSA